MTAQVSNQRRERRSSASGTLFRWVLALFLLVTVGWFIYVYQQIDAVANMDEAQPADAIAVFGAAEYSGRPSPVLHLRLDHAVELYRRQVAPLIITLGGGSDKDSGNTEGGVGRDYLLANGVPFGNIIAETRSVDTEQQVHRLAAIARENNLHHIVVVSDATHLFRIRELCKDAGLDVYTSPRATIGHISNYDLAMRYFHEILSYTSLRLGLDVSWLRSWLEGKEEY
jgi:uncharacterized SAM-binding protein YcdF (DUF218 family)